MLLLNQINYELVEQDNFIDALSNYPEGAVAFDYETYNHVNGELAKEPWNEYTHPFMFSVCNIENPEGNIKVFKFNNLTQEQKNTLERFLTSRSVWAFNCKFEAAVTWKLLGKFLKFQDVQSLYKVSGEFINNMSLKKGTAKLLNVPEWSEAVADTVFVLTHIVAHIQNKYGKKGKTDEWIDAYLAGDIERIYELVNTKVYTNDNLTKDDAEFVSRLLRVKPILTSKVLTSAIKFSEMEPQRINFKYVPIEVVARYCAYDAYATAYNYKTLYKNCAKQYPIFIKQSWLATIIEAYGMTRNLSREYEIEMFYQEQILHYMEKIFSIPEFADMVNVNYVDKEINPETGRLKSYPKQRKGLEIEDYAYIKQLINKQDDNKPLNTCEDCKKTNDYCSTFASRENRREVCQNCLKVSALKKKYWNYNANRADKIEVFYNALFASDRAKSAVVAYHIKKHIAQLEGFVDIVDGQEISKAKNIKWDTVSDIVPQAIQYIETQHSIAKQNLSKKIGGSNFHSNTNFMVIYGISDNDETVVEYKKWAKERHKIKKTIKQAVDLNVAPPQGERAKFVDIEDIRLSLKKENMEILYNALYECADMSPDVPWDEMAWEMKLVFCCKVIKKLDKALSSWVRGRVGHDRVRSCVFGNSLLDVPVRKEGASNYLFQTSFNECSADTKRWKSPVHAIPRGSELSEMYQTRKDDSILVHFDYSQIEIRTVAALSKDENLLKLFRENPKADIHRLMASRVWGKKPEDVSGEERRASKGCSFGILYGMSVESLADTYFKGNVSIAKDVLNKFYSAYPNIKKWCDARHAQIDTNGYVQTLFGDRIFIDSKNKGDRHRRSQNYPVQSTASNIAGYAIWNLWEYCQQNNIEAIPQCFIHDSSDWDVRLKDLILFIKAVNKCTVEDISEKFNVPMKIDFELGVNLNFTMHIENAEYVEGGIKFDFKCPDVFYKQILERLGSVFDGNAEISGYTTETESWANLFVTKRPYSMYLNKPIKIYEGQLILKGSS